MSDPEAVIWHDLECGLYRQDLTFWCDLAATAEDAVLDVGAGSGRVTLELARRGHRVVALDNSEVLLTALSARAGALPGEASAQVSTVVADARDFDLGDRRFGLCVVPMQTIQLLGGREGRVAFLACARRHLVDGGMLAMAIAPEFDEFVWHDGDVIPLPDIVELGGTVYASQPTAVRAEGSTVVLERRREVIDPMGGHVVSEDHIALDRLTAATLITEGASVGLTAAGTHVIPETDEHVGSLVVEFRA